MTLLVKTQGTAGEEEPLQWQLSKNRKTQGCLDLVPGSAFPSCAPGGPEARWALAQTEESKAWPTARGKQGMATLVGSTVAGKGKSASEKSGKEAKTPKVNSDGLPFCPSAAGWMQCQTSYSGAPTP